MSRCRSCGAEIYWQKSFESWQPMNMNGVSHFETCPQAKQWKGNKFPNSSHDYTKPKSLEDKKQVRLKTEDVSTA